MIGQMQGKFPADDGFQIDLAGFIRAYERDEAAWIARLDKQFAAHQKEGDYGRVVAWIGLFAPRGTPEARITRLAAEAAAALSAPETHRGLTTAGFEPLGTPPAPLAALVRAEVAHWGEVIQRLGIRPES